MIFGGGGAIQFWNWNCDSIPISVLVLVKLEIYGTEIETLGMKIMWMELKFLAVAKQLYECFSPSVHLFVTRGGGGTPYMMGDTYVPRFWPPFLTLWVPNSIFLGCVFLIVQHKNDLLGTNPHKIRSFWTQNTIFPSIFLGPIFSGPRHTPSNFRTEYPPPPGSSHLFHYVPIIVSS